MKLTEPIIAELKQEADTTRKMLERLPQESLAWKPHEKSRTLGQVAAHIADIPGVFIAGLENDELNFRDAKPTSADTAANIVEAFDENVKRAIEVLGTLNDEQMTGVWRLKFGEQVVFEMPRFAVVRAVGLNHLIHHRGQLSVYMRLLDVPVPPIYGPTADEA